MKLYSYVITRDYGFAPNPYLGMCTLATCKPQVRQYASSGDWVAGFGGKDTPVYEKLVCLMKVSEKLTFDQYWNDDRFENKKPNFLRSLKYYYGDNIYHHDKLTGEWLQENSHHSFGNDINYKNLKRDTSRDFVLVSYVFWYFGRDAIQLPKEFENLIKYNIGIKAERNPEVIENLVDWISLKFENGINGTPFSWKQGIGFERYKGV